MRIPLFIFSLLIHAILPGGRRISVSESPIAVWHDIHLSYISPERARGIFDQVLPEPVVETTTDGISLFATASEHAHVVRILRQIDLPSMTSQTRFIRLHHSKADDVARLLRIILKTTIGQADLKAVAEHRTNRIFIMGEPKRQAVAESIITFIDRCSAHSPRRLNTRISHKPAHTTAVSSKF
jgi:hypothetical protein